MSDAGVEIDNFVLRATIKTEKPAMSKLKMGGRDASAARLASRPAFWNHFGWQETPVYNRAKLKPGNGFDGPAIIEAEDTTVVVEPGWSFEVDAYGSALLRKIAAAS